MLLAPLLAPVISFIFREIVIKFFVFTAIFSAVALLVPIAVEYLGPFVGVGGLSAAFGGLPGSIWFFLDFLNLGFGVPLLISAWVTRFLIRRLPVIG